jgi:hypothetical protein
MAHAEVDVSLKGSRASMLRQNRIARQEAFSFLRTPQQVQSHVAEGELVELGGNDDYDVIAGYPFARPVVRAFIERLSAKYREACGEQLVVTSLTRPSGRQPRNASPLSVHPAGMAVDLRVSRDAGCREWLSAELLGLETMGLLDATLERRPPHYHIAVFPEFAGYHARLAAEEEAEEQRRAVELARAQAEVSLALLHVTPRSTPDAPGSVLKVIASVVALLFLPISV